MSTDTHEKCFKVLRNLRFDWTQDPEIVRNERLTTIGLESEYLKTDLELFKFFIKSYIKIWKKNIDHS